jgi:uncharacterized protein GlcG (DUF336 family)
MALRNGGHRFRSRAPLRAFAVWASLLRCSTLALVETCLDTRRTPSAKRGYGHPSWDFSGLARPEYHHLAGLSCRFGSDVTYVKRPGSILQKAGNSGDKSALGLPRKHAIRPDTLPTQRKLSMAELTLDVARKILDAALAKSIEKKLKPLVVTILDVRGCIKAAAAQDGTSLMRGEIAHGKAYGALAMGMGSRALFQRAQEQAYFIGAANTLAQGRMIPVPGGVLIQDGGTLVGAVGISGDTSDNDEACAIAGIEAVGLKANPG